eukprot:14170408-Alexandrium_andersonii.AAC.1
MKDSSDPLIISSNPLQPTDDALSTMELFQQDEDEQGQLTLDAQEYDLLQAKELYDSEEAEQLKALYPP